MNRFTAGVLSLSCFAMIFSCCGCSVGPKKDVNIIVKLPPISMDAVNDKEVEESEQFFKKAAHAFEQQYTDADVTVSVEMFEYLKEEEAVEGSYGTENAPDVLYEGYFNMGTYIHGGNVVPLDDIISEDLKNDIDESLWEMSSTNGKTYMMPFLSLQNILAYNKQLFSECGLEEYIDEDPEHISSWTIEEWEYILDTLAQKLPQGCYPMMMYGKNNQGDTHIMTFIRSRGSSLFDANGMFNVSTSDGIAALQWIKDGYSRGWYPPKCENLEISDNTDLFSNNQLAITVSNNALFTNFDKENYGCVNFPGNDGSGYATSFVTGFEIFDNGDKDKLKVSKEFVRFIMENDEWADYSTGGIPARNSVSEKYKDKIFMLESCVENNKNVVDFTHNNPNWRGVREVFYPNINDLLSGRKTAKEAAEAIDSSCNAAIEEGRRNSILHD